MPGRPESKEFIALKSNEKKIRQIIHQIHNKEITRRELTEKYHVNYEKLHALLLHYDLNPMWLRYQKGRPEAKLTEILVQAIEEAHKDNYGYQLAAQAATEYSGYYCSASKAHQVYQDNGWLVPQKEQKEKHTGVIYIGVAGELFHTDITFFSRKDFKHLYEDPTIKPYLEAASKEKEENAKTELGFMAFINAGSRVVLGYCWLFRKTAKETTRALRLFIEGAANDDDVVQGLPGWKTSHNNEFNKHQLKRYGIVTDNGKEYLNGEFDEYLIAHGIKYLVIDKMCKEHNGKIERFWRFGKHCLESPTAIFDRIMYNKNEIFIHRTTGKVPMNEWIQMHHYRKGEPLSECNRYKIAPYYEILEQKQKQLSQQLDPNSAEYQNRCRDEALLNFLQFRLAHPEQFQDTNIDEWW